ncbi:MAG: SIMPL domain-containing protein [Hyphomicrobium sp.]|nr:MAG: SIMPL domain-containing protein [Hyphomicrobium sp.]PPD00111.1 MAG: SIMPL domain-containing protein [Hyphomicrobium sp.]
MTQWNAWGRNTVMALIAMVSLQTAGAIHAQAEDKAMERTITVSATGVVHAEPDQARLSSGVVSEAPTARDALTKNTEAMKQVIAELKSSGIEAKDIQTSSFNVEPVTVYGKEGQAPRITGYRVANQVSILVRDFSKLGAVLDQVITVGANQLNGLSFEVSKEETLKDDARKEAMANALRRAKLLAEAGGATVGDVMQISEDVAYQGPRPFANVRMAKAESVPIEAGTSALEARVTVTYALK